MKAQKIKVQDIVDTLAITTLLFSSGGNMILRNIGIFLAAAVLLFIYTKHINIKYLVICGSVIGYVVVDSLLLNSAPSDLKECILLVLRLLGCFIIASNIDEKKFCLIFVNVLAILSVVSLMCFGLLLLGIGLPGTIVKNGWCGTFYHTLGIGGTVDFATMTRKRNCGIFTEPGIYQIYLNTALLFLMREDIFSVKKRRRLFLLFSVTILSTMSSMGYIIYALVLVLYYIEKKYTLYVGMGDTISARLFLLFIALVIGLVFESYLGVVMDLVKSTNSFASRHDDTLLTFLIASDYPVWGIGLATDPLSFWDLYYEKYESLRIYKGYQNAMSCGLGNYLCMGGIPFTCVYCISIIKSYIQKSGVVSKITKVGVAAIVILILLEEPLMPTPFFLISFYYGLHRRKLDSSSTRENVFTSYECGIESSRGNSI